MTKEIGTSALLDTWGSSVVPGYASEKIPDLSKITQGWQLGERPPHEFMNWIQNQFGQKLNHVLSRGVADWNADTLYLVGSLVRHDGRVWMSFVENSNSEPGSGNANWSALQDELSGVLTEDILVEVGAGGDFPTISAAIAELSRLKRGYSSELLVAEIRLRAGFVMEEAVLAIAIDLSWMTITGVDAVTMIARDALPQESFTPQGRFPAFLAFGNAALPNLAQLFEMDETGSSTARDGLFLYGGSAVVTPNSGVKKAGGIGAHVAGGRLFSETGVFDGALEDGIRSTRSATVSFEGGSAKGCGGFGVFSDKASTADAGNADLVECGQGGAISRRAAHINLRGADCRVGATAGSDDIQVIDGGHISALDAQGGTNVTPNAITSAGIIFK